MRYLSIRREIEGALSTVVEVLREKNELEALRVMMQADIEFLKTGYDNWNGGTELWTVYLRVPVKIFVSIENMHEHIASLISQYLELVVGKDNGYWTSVEIKPLRASAPGPNVPSGTIGERTRAAILDEMRARKTVWFGDLNEIGFLNRIFDLRSMPSEDPRFETAEGDIWQHCVNNDDWAQDWIYSDRRFRIYSADQRVFLKFISEVLHPIV